jgi:UDP-N-acetylglucosamine--N-acetylmuramyl-(pentapeptide) pyrophosphoryl-undecaprenol N-acetylglucosamine transferase
MKILLPGGGSGGHFYPIIAVAEELNELCKENRILRPELFYMSTDDYNEGLLYENGIIFKKVSTGKIRRAFSVQNIIQNFFDLFKTFFGTLGAIVTIFNIYQDVIFGKGGYASFPALFAARILRIPVVIHESDTAPGKVNGWAGKFAEKIAVSYPESANFFPAGKTAYTGNPVRKELLEPLSVGAREFLHLQTGVPVVFVLGGSQGSQKINEAIMDILPELVSKYEIIHQTGKKNIEIMKETAEVVLDKNPDKDRYKPFDYLNVLSMRMAAGVADVIASRAGSTIFEIASWGVPSIIIPIPEKTSHDQRTNAYAYARSGACEVIEEKNLTGHILLAEINRIVNSPDEKKKMSDAARAFSRKDSARLIAKEILDIALSHEK